MGCDEKTRLGEAAAEALNAGDLERTEAVLEQALARFSQEAGFHFGKAVLLGRRGALAEALQAAAKAASLDPGHFKAKALQRELEEKLRLAGAVGEGAMDDPQTLLDAALEALEKDDGVEALHCCHKAKAAGLDAPNLEYIRAMGFIQIGDYRFAVLALEQELARYPENGAARALLQQVEEELGAKG